MLSVYQECSAIDNVPATHVEYLTTDIICSSPGAARRYLDLGVKCGESYVSRDYFFECGKLNEYETRPDEFRFSCFSAVEVTPDSTDTPVQIPSVEAYTDYRYVFLAADNCYSYLAPTVTTSRTPTPMKNLVDTKSGDLSSLPMSSEFQGSSAVPGTTISPTFQDMLLPVLRVVGVALALLC